MSERNSGVTLDFCGNCAVLLTETLDTDLPETCENCMSLVEDRSNRAQGLFSWDDAQKMLRIWT